MPLFGWSLVAVAFLSPLCTSLSDGLTKWLLSAEGDGLSRSELLVVRFVPATIVLGIWAGLGQGITIREPLVTLPVAFVFGFGPLWMFCTAIGQTSLTQAAVWEFLIPGLAFFGTLPAHWEAHARPLPLVGAVLVIAALLVSELPLVEQWILRTRRPMPSPAPAGSAADRKGPALSSLV